MMRYTLIIVLLVGAVGLPAPEAAVGQTATFYFTDADNNQQWNDPDNWKTDCSGSSAGAVPGATDDAVICTGKIARIADTAAVARAVTIQSGASTRIEIQPGATGATLMLGSNSSALTSSISGDIQLLAPSTGSNFATLRITSADHTFSGFGCIDGRDDLAELTIDSGRKLTNSASVVGRMKITGSGEFVNNGDVDADINGGTLLVRPSALDDTSSARWRALGSAILKFSADISTVTGGSLAGDFVITSSAKIENAESGLVSTGNLQMTGGELLVTENLTLGDNTSNSLSFGAGLITVKAGKTFTHE